MVSKGRKRCLSPRPIACGESVKESWFGRDDTVAFGDYG